MRSSLRVMSLVFLILFTISTVTSASLVLTLEKAISLGLESDHQLISYNENIEQIEYELAPKPPPLEWSWNTDVTVAEYKPTLTGQEFIPFSTDLRGEVRWGDFALRGNTFAAYTFEESFQTIRNNLTLSYNRQILQPVEFSKQSVDKRNNEHTLSKIKLDMDTRIMDRAFEVIEEYVRLLKFYDSYQNAQNNFSRVEVADREIMIRYELGFASKLDILDSEITVKQTELSLASTEARFERELERFLEFLGIPVEDVELVDIREQLDLEIQMQADELIKAGIENSIELKKIELDLKHLNFELDKIISDEGPNVVLESNYSPINGELSFFIKGSYSMSSNSHSQRRIEDKVAEIEITKTRYEKEKENISNAIYMRLSDLDDIYKNLELYDLKLGKSEMELASARERFDHGLISEIVMEQAIQSHKRVLREIDDLKLDIVLKKIEILLISGFDIISIVRGI